MKHLYILQVAISSYMNDYLEILPMPVKDMRWERLRPYVYFDSYDEANRERCDIMSDNMKFHTVRVKRVGWIKSVFIRLFYPNRIK